MVVNSSVDFVVRVQLDGLDTYEAIDVYALTALNYSAGLVSPRSHLQEYLDFIANTMMWRQRRMSTGV